MKLPIGDIEVQLETKGRVALRALSFADLRWIESSLKVDHDARAFARRWIDHQQRVNDDADHRHVDWTAEELDVAIAAWSADPAGLGRDLDPEDLPESFRLAAVQTVDKHNRSMTQMNSQMSGVSSVMKDAINSADAMIKNQMGLSGIGDAARYALSNSHMGTAYATGAMASAMRAGNIASAVAMSPSFKAIADFGQSAVAGSPNADAFRPSTSAIDSAIKSISAGVIYPNPLSLLGPNIAAKTALDFRAGFTSSGLMTAPGGLGLGSYFADAMRDATTATMNMISPPGLLPGMRAATDLLTHTKLAFDRMTVPVMQQELSGLIQMNSASARILESIRSTALDYAFDAQASKISSDLFTMSTAATKVFSEWSGDERGMRAAGVALRRAPHFELYTAARVAKIAVTRGRKEAEETVPRQDLELVNAKVESMLRDLSEEFLVPYRGAAEVLHNRGTDHIRHFSASFRELLTHVMHGLSPDAEVREWSTSAEDFNNGKPTRSARLRYIYRKVSSGKYSQFVEADIANTLAMFDFLQQGTHRLSSALEDDDLQLMWVRANGVLAVLLTAARKHGR